MKSLKLHYILTIILLLIATFGSADFVYAQNLQSVSGYTNRHDALLARQSRIKDQIKIADAEQYASQLYEESEPEPDIYLEGWDSGLVNSYKDAIIPNTKDIDVSEFCMPHSGYVTSPFGYRPRFRRQHKGIDLGLHVGDTSRAAFSGKVRLTKFERRGYGFYVIIRHENGLETVYGHLSRFLVQPDQYVKVGDPIALGGNTGHSTGPHLHFETRFMGVAINPAAIFDFENQTTHTDIFTFNKNSYNNSRSYAPKSRYKARKSRSRSNAYKRGGSKGGTHKVRKGENLGEIAARYGTTVSKLRRLNGMGKSNKITAGKSLRVK